VVNTGKGCHLDAHMVGHTFKSLEAEEDSILFIKTTHKQERDCMISGFV
jgi:Ni2+-binding GTPase involved in maturation of urease and hydrogenase